MAKDGKKIAIGAGIVTGVLALIFALTRKAKAKFVCPYCGAEFDTQEALEDHIATEHPGQPTYPCPYCDAIFASQQELDAHIASAHPTPEPPEPEPGTALLSGTITDAQTLAGIWGVLITVYQDVTATQTKSYEVSTDHNGFYFIPNMVSGVRAEMACEAGGYRTVTKSFSIIEGKNEQSFTMTWVAETRDVPRLISYNLPTQIENGKNFTGGVTVWFPPAGSVKYTIYLRIKPQVSTNHLMFGTYASLDWRIVNASIYDESVRRGPLYFDPSSSYYNYMKKKGYLKIANEGGTYTFESTILAPAKTPPPGICNVEVRINRNHTSVALKGPLTGYSSDNPEFWWWEAIVGTVKVI